MSNLSDFLGGSIFTNTKNYLLPRTSTFTSVGATLSWNSNDIDMIIIDASFSGGALTINADGGNPVDGQRFLFRVKTPGSQQLNFSKLSLKSFRPIGTSFIEIGDFYRYQTPAGGFNVYFGCIYNATDSKWDIVSISEQTVA